MIVDLCGYSVSFGRDFVRFSRPRGKRRPDRLNKRIYPKIELCGFRKHSEASANAGEQGLTAGRRRLRHVPRERLARFIVSGGGELPENPQLLGEFAPFGDARIFRVPAGFARLASVRPPCGRNKERFRRLPEICVHLRHLRLKNLRGTAERKFVKFVQFVDSNSLRLGVLAGKLARKGFRGSDKTLHLLKIPCLSVFSVVKFSLASVSKTGG